MLGNRNTFLPWPVLLLVSVHCVCNCSCLIHLHPQKYIALCARLQLLLVFARHRLASQHLLPCSSEWGDRQTDRQPWRGLRVPFQLFCLPETESFSFGIITKRLSFLRDEQIPVCYWSVSAQNYLFYIWEWILGMAVTLFMWLCRVSHTCGCCVCPRGSLDSVSVLLWQLRVPGLLLSSCSGWGRSRGSLGWVLLSGFTSSALVSPLRSVNDLGKLDWEHRELSPVIPQQQQSCTRSLCPRVPPGWRVLLKRWMNLGVHVPQWQIKFSPTNCL